MKNTPPKCYRCTDYGADATAHEEEGFFVVHAGSKFGPIRNRCDNMMLNFRHALRRAGAFKRGLVLKGDEKFLYADETARIVTGCLCDETSWIAEDGSHPKRIAPEIGK